MGLSCSTPCNEGLLAMPAPREPAEHHPGLSPPHCHEQRPFQLGACTSESAGTLVISLSSHASSLKSVRLNNEGTGDLREEESPCRAIFRRRDVHVGTQQGPSVHPSDALPSRTLGLCYRHVPFPKGYADINKLSLMASLQFSLASS